MYKKVKKEKKHEIVYPWFPKRVFLLPLSNAKVGWKVGKQGGKLVVFHWNKAIYVSPNILAHSSYHPDKKMMSKLLPGCLNHVHKFHW